MHVLFRYLQNGARMKSWKMNKPVNMRKIPKKMKLALTFWMKQEKCLFIDYGISHPSYIQS